MFISLLNVKGYILAVGKYDRFYDRSFILQRDDLLLPELIIEDYPEDVSSILKPLFDSLWNAFGWQRSLHYDEEGKWKL